MRLILVYLMSFPSVKSWDFYPGKSTRDWEDYKTFAAPWCSIAAVSQFCLPVTVPPATSLALLSTSGILTHAVGTDTPLDAIEISVAALRAGASLAEADLLVLHPNTWSALRRTKDSQGAVIWSILTRPTLRVISCGVWNWFPQPRLPLE
jgi:hypothetical protein